MILVIRHWHEHNGFNRIRYVRLTLEDTKRRIAEHYARPHTAKCDYEVIG